MAVRKGRMPNMVFSGLLLHEGPPSLMSILFLFLNFFFFLDDFLFELIDEHIDPRIEFR